MGEPAKAFWIKEEDLIEPVPEMEFEDVSFLSTGEQDEAWMFGSD